MKRADLLSLLLSSEAFAQFISHFRNFPTIDVSVATREFPAWIHIVLCDLCQQAVTFYFFLQLGNFSRFDVSYEQMIYNITASHRPEGRKLSLTQQGGSHGIASFRCRTRHAVLLRSDARVLHPTAACLVRACAIAV